ncbi:MAG: hypothetical protein COA65_08795 [Rhodospirillaceae bacterium]|nr:MAG: hypothetical protein COA65_08795 [Rhodospirillaceae bacterium]
MEANELRIGNWYNSIRFNTPIRLHLEDFAEASIHADGADSLEWFDTHIEPIPLTNEWLKDFGIEKLHVSGLVVSGVTYWRKGGIVFYKNRGKYYVPIGEKMDKPGHTVIEFDKVHELQNIFALTGKELTLKYNENH